MQIELEGLQKLLTRVFPSSNKIKLQILQLAETCSYLVTANSPNRFTYLFKYRCQNFLVHDPNSDYKICYSVYTKCTRCSQRWMSVLLNLSDICTTLLYFTAHDVTIINYTVHNYYALLPLTNYSCILYSEQCIMYCL